MQQPQHPPPSPSTTAPATTSMDTASTPEPYGIPCGLEGCAQSFSSTNARKVHIRSVHQTAVSITLPNGEQRTIERSRQDQMFHCPFCAKFSQANAGNFGKHVRICRGGEAPAPPSEPAQSGHGWSSINGSTNPSQMDLDIATPAPTTHSPPPPQAGTLSIDDARSLITAALMASLMHLSRRSLYPASAGHPSFSSSSTSINTIPPHPTHTPSSSIDSQELVDASIDGIKSCDTLFQLRLDRLQGLANFVGGLRVPEGCTVQKKEAMGEIIATALRALVELSSTIKEAVREGAQPLGGSWDRVAGEIDNIVKRCGKLIKTVYSLGRKDGEEGGLPEGLIEDDEDEGVGKRGSLVLSGDEREGERGGKKMRTG
ncbi:hypothetical protein BJ508DRAFT_310765 [Ascobolus immersus RN42]|uniref:C2H2-type domain-containing protein n=1 Tax=Ascobolus immersus RN42 TaxID=1160509 RepID=A0A3N4HXY7_ASCIM|nr:hypothetical protein BJ508DRAFT_310765 [Ascobolus immersus RN42]